ncbi:hypothetical protein LCGC14_0405130 [marine sediment metagenome]|uniref:Uncharacterized protein n=1 Tax=marine sediment metagenome TaxID=412755 RepID=A0A0F9T139_9ZZZZ
MVALTPVAKHSNNPFQFKVLKVELATRRTNNTLDPFVDITRFVKKGGISRLSKSIDSNDFDIGFFEQSNLTLTLDNSQGQFMKGRGFFVNKIIDRSRVKVVAGFRNIDDGTIDSETTFEGILSAETANASLRSETITYKILSFSSLITRLRSRSAAVDDGMDFRTAIFNLLNINEIKTYITVDINNINPKFNGTVDSGVFFEGKQLDESINKLLLASNSVLKIKNNTIFIQDREQSVDVKFEYFGKGGTRPANIIDISNYNEGDKRIITRVQFEGDLGVFDSPDFIIDKFGAKLKRVDIGFITNTIKKFGISQDILGEFQFPKTEFQITGPYLGEQVDLLDLITVDNPGYDFNTNVALYDSPDSEYDTDDVYASSNTGLIIDKNLGFKVLKVEHDFARYQTKLKVRRIGSKEFDGQLS